MNAPEVSTHPLPRYGIREDEMTRPGVVLFDWNADDETVRVSPFTIAELGPGDEDDEEEDDDDGLEASLFGRRFQGIGRRPGAVALGIVLALSVGIGVCAMFTSGDAQAGTQAVTLSDR